MESSNVLEVGLPMEAKTLESVVRIHCEHNGVWDDCTVVDSAGFDAYQEQARKTDVYPELVRTYDHLLGLASEVGELCGKVKKADRDHTPVPRADIIHEIGDVLWYLSAVCDDCKTTLREAAEENIRKLRDRAARNRIGGSGDDR